MFRVMLVVLFVAGSFGCASTGSVSAPPEPLDRGTIVSQGDRSVTCLLPGQVRQLGRHKRIVEAPREAQMPAIECEIRGGRIMAQHRTRGVL